MNSFNPVFKQTMKQAFLFMVCDVCSVVFFHDELEVFGLECSLVLVAGKARLVSFPLFYFISVQGRKRR